MPPAVDINDITQVTVLREELATLGPITTWISTQPNIPEQVLNMCARVQYVIGMTEKTFQAQFQESEATNIAIAGVNEDISSEALQQVGDEGDDARHPDDYEFPWAESEDEVMEATAVASNSSLCAAPPPINNEEYPSPGYSMAKWETIKKKATRLDLPRPQKVAKQSAIAIGSGKAASLGPASGATPLVPLVLGGDDE